MSKVFVATSIAYSIVLESLWYHALCVTETLLANAALLNPAQHYSAGGRWYTSQAAASRSLA